MDRSEDKYTIANCRFGPLSGGVKIRHVGCGKLEKFACCQYNSLSWFNVQSLTDFMHYSLHVASSAGFVNIVDQFLDVAGDCNARDVCGMCGIYCSFIHSFIHSFVRLFVRSFFRFKTSIKPFLSPKTHYAGHILRTRHTTCSGIEKKLNSWL